MVSNRPVDFGPTGDDRCTLWLRLHCSYYCDECQFLRACSKAEAENRRQHDSFWRTLLDMEAPKRTRGRLDSVPRRGSRRTAMRQAERSRGGTVAARRRDNVGDYCAVRSSSPGLYGMCRGLQAPWRLLCLLHPITSPQERQHSSWARSRSALTSVGTHSHALVGCRTVAHPD